MVEPDRAIAAVSARAASEPTSRGGNIPLYLRTCASTRERGLLSRQGFNEGAVGHVVENRRTSRCLLRLVVSLEREIA